MEVTKEEFEALEKRYNEAVKRKEASFKFKDQEILTSFAKYLIEYYKPKMEKL